MDCVKRVLLSCMLCALVVAREVLDVGCTMCGTCEQLLFSCILCALVVVREVLDVGCTLFDTA